MQPGEFEKLDEQWMKRTSSLRKKTVPPETLKGLSDTVIDRIREKKAPVSAGPRHARLVPPARVWAPVFAVLILGVVAVTRLPVSGLSQEIEMLVELGEWEDEGASLEDLELAS